MHTKHDEPLSIKVFYFENCIFHLKMYQNFLALLLINGETQKEKTCVLLWLLPQCKNRIL